MVSMSNYRQNRMKNDGVMSEGHAKSGSWPILGLKLAILAIFFKISTSNLFCQHLH